MKDEENIFEDLENEEIENILEDELVSSDSQEIEEQPTMDVPSNSNGRNFVENAKKVNDYRNNLKNNKEQGNVQQNNIKNSQDFAKNNKDTINKLNDVKSKGQGLNSVAGNAGKELGNKLAGKSEEEKSGLEKKTDDIGGKAAGAAITAATGGAVSGPLAEAAGNVAYQLLKKEMERRKKKIMIGVAIGVSVFLIFFAIIFFNDDDQSDTSVVTNRYVTGQMSMTELLEYLSHINVCPNITSIQEEIGETDNIFEAIINNGKIIWTCKNAVTYYMSLKDEYDENREKCYYNRLKINGELSNFWKTKEGNEAIYDNNPKVNIYFKGSHWTDDADCQLELPTQLLMETMSYGLDDQELFNSQYKDRYVDYPTDLRRLSNALSEFVHEYCYQWENTINGVNDGTNCDPADAAKKGITCKKAKVRYDGYYFQVSFNKYVSYLKYGDTSSHPNYSKEPLIKGNPNDYYAHECVGPENDVLEKHYDYNPGPSDTEPGGTDIVNCSGKLGKLFKNKCPSTELEMKQYLVTISVPVVDVNGNRSTRQITVHKDLANDLIDIFTQIADGNFPIKDLGCYNWRKTASGGISHHSFGVACDINSNENYMIKNGKIIAGSYWKPGEDPYSIPTDGVVVRAFKSKGWVWGGNWNSSKDYMHFSYTGG